MTTAEAVEHLQAELKKDPNFYEAYKANIAVAFQDEFEAWKHRTGKDRPNRTDVHEISNNAAKRFLYIFLLSPK